MVTVVGTEYIQDLTSGEEFQANSKVSGIVLGLKFVAGLSGICAIKAIGCDWETDWIGKIPRTGPVWYGMVRGTGNVFYFNHSDLHCANDITSLDPSSTDQIMWDTRAVKARTDHVPVPSINRKHRHSSPPPLHLLTTFPGISTPNIDAKMGIIRKTLNTLILGSAGSAGAFAFWTRNSKFVPLPQDDPIFSSAAYRRNNPNRNPETKDLCVRKVELAKIKPQLLEKEGEGRLVEAFCAGVWGGIGYTYQRSYLEKKYKNDTTAHQLWSRSQLLSSNYAVGTQITDHFEVVSKTPEAIVVRCGDSPLKTGVRDSDGLFEMGVKINREEGVAEFRLKSVFYKGLGTATSAPMPSHVEFAHRLYTKLWMESAVQNVVM